MNKINILKYPKKYFLVFFVILLLNVLVQSIFNPLFVFQEIDYLFQPYDLRGYAKGIIYISAYLSYIIGMILILGIESSLIFGIILFFIFILYSVDFFVQLIGISRGFSMDKYTLAMNEANNYEFLISYIDYIGYSLILALLFILILFMMRKIFYKNKYSSKWALLIIISIVSVSFASTKVSSITLSSFPSFTKFPGIMVWYEMQPKAAFIERILDSNITVSKEAKIKNIIWIIDESITGSYLSINGYDQNTTPYLSSLLETTDIVTNYGIVNSVSNCSSPSNFYLRLGLNPRLNFDFKQSSLTLPTIYHYARRAGYETWFYDSQAAKDTLQNGLSIYDVKQIDHFHTLERTVLPRKRDAIFVDDVSNVLRDNESDKKFIVLVKFGAHFPYLLSYDNKNTFFRPAMEVTYGGMTLENKEKLINTYLNSIRNNTDLYIKNLLTKIDLSNTVIFYTSDHGQNILETETKATHCNKENIVKNEVTVPLLVLHQNANKRFSIDPEKNYSQIQMFPTTLSLMGYSNEIVDKYGVTLWGGLSKTEKRKYYVPYEGKVAVYE